jgi:hypothetical protein
MSLPGAATKQYPLEVLTENYLIKCVVEPVGMLMTYLDSPDRTNFCFKDLILTGLGTDSTVDSIKIKELWVQRSEVLAICLNEADLEGTVQKLPAQEKLRIYMPRFMIQGTLTRGQDTRLGDMFEVMKRTWAAVHQAHVFPLTTLKAHPFRETPFLLVNKDKIRFYEAISAN